MNQEQLKEKILRIVEDTWGTNLGGIDEFLDQIISLISKDRAEPMGVSAWKNYGVKYKYWDYFVKEVLAEQVKAIEEIGKIKVHPCNCCYNPDGMSDKRCPSCFYGDGFNQALSQVLSLLKNQVNH